MLRPRIIPCLLIKNDGLVKTTKFEKPKYVGDPLNAVRIFNEKQADELVVLDIEATVLGKEPNYQLIKNLAAECRMPLCYGGGVKTVEHFKEIISLGVEKVAISSAAIDNPNLITEAAQVVGSQSVVVVVDVKKKLLSNKYSVCIHNGKTSTKLKLEDYVKLIEALGAGEVVINSIDQDGMMKGYDFNLINQIRSAISLPITALGGAGSLVDIRDLINRYGVIGASAGSLFVFKGKYRAVLINYPSQKEKDEIAVI